MSAGRLDRQRAALVVVDVQEAFRKAVADFESVAEASAKLVRGAEALRVPVIVTEQYPKGLGSTVAEVAGALPEGVEPIAKSCFSAAEADGFDLEGRDQALVCGIEAHVCVSQTVLDLLASDVTPYIASDAVASRHERDREIGLARLREAGAVITSIEAALFELLRGSDAEEFKEIQALIK